MAFSKALLFFLLSFLGGIFISSFFKIPELILGELVLLGLFYSLVFLKQRAVLVFGLCLLLFACGLYRGSAAVKPDYTAQSRGCFSAVREKLQDVIDKNLSPPQDGILSAILLGNKDRISQDFKEKLNQAGIRHITAISGMHIVILSSLLLWLGIAVGFYRGQAFYFSLAFLWLFILMIGSPSSAVRAGIMGSVFLFCEKIGRQKTADRALLLAGAVMLVVNPSLLRYSIGFQLSFSAALGIIYLMPLIQNLLKKLIVEGIRFPRRKEHGSFHGILSLISMSLAAQIFVLPLLIYYFGQVSVVSPLTNLLVVPLLPYLMGAGFLFVITGAIWQGLGLIFLFPVWLMLAYIVKITEVFSFLSFSTLQFNIHWLWLAAIYGLLTIAIWQIKKRQRAFVLF